MKVAIMFLVSVALSFILDACASPGPAVPIPTATAPVITPGPTAKTAWEVEWENTLAKSRKEGRLSVITSTFSPKLAAEIFTKKYGIAMDVISGSGGALSEKIKAERRAGVYAVDLYIGGGNPIVTALKPYGVLSYLPSAFILPEVKDEKAWWEGKHPFMDKESIIFTLATYPSDTLQINVEMIGKEDVSSYYDLLTPKWKGKIVSGDPTIPGSALKWFSVMVEKTHGPILGMDYMRKLASQEPVILRDDRLAAEWLVRGKYPLIMNMGLDVLLETFRKEGVKVPTARLTPKEGGYVTGGAGYLVLVDKAPHPNAARVFINWLLSREGQIEYSNISLKHSTRIDIPAPQEINPRMIAREPGVKYIQADTEEFLLKTEEHIRMATEVFGHLVR